MAFDMPIAAMTLFCEASSETDDVRQAVAWTLRNRLASGKFGKTLAAVCLARYQFSEWNDDKADNVNLLRAAQADDNEPALQQCWHDMALVRSAAADSDPTLGATHYHETLMAEYPSWTVGATKTAQIGPFTFYKDVP